MNNLTITVKKFTKEYLKENSDIVFRNRELIVEEDDDGIQEHKVYRFKLGDGVTPYRNLKHISSLYALLPDVIFYDNTYKNSLTIKFTEQEE